MKTRKPKKGICSVFHRPLLKQKNQDMNAKRKENLLQEIMPSSWMLLSKMELKEMVNVKKEWEFYWQQISQRVEAIHFYIIHSCKNSPSNNEHVTNGPTRNAQAANDIFVEEAK